MIRISLIALAGLMVSACTIDGPEPGSVSPTAELERQDRIRAETERRQQLCRMLDRERDRDRYERDCAQDGGHH